MKHLLLLTELRTLGRPIGKVSDEKLTAFITEAEQLYIKSVLGDELFLRILENDEINDENITKLLDGGIYTDKRGCLHSFMGLKVALSYFVYAQNLMSSDIESTRYGTVMKNGDFSTHISSKERSDAYNNALEVAKAYLQECVDYCKELEIIKSVRKSKYNIGGITIRRIG